MLRRPAAGWLVAALGWVLLVVLVDRSLGHEVTVMRERHAAEEVAEWRRLRDPRDDVAEIYGVAEPGGSTRLLLPPWETGLERFHPPEDPARTLLFVDRAPGVHLVSTRVLWPVAIGGGLLLLLGARLARRR